MRERNTDGTLSVHGISGTYVVMLGFDMPQVACNGLLGFSIHRTSVADNEADYLRGMKCFAETDPGFEAGATYSTADHPIQSFQWADYTVMPGQRYRYEIVALRGTPTALQPFASVEITIDTESPPGGVHDIYFNRGVAASQAYVRRFGDHPPDEVPYGRAYEWLSRGLYEGLHAFLEDGASSQYAFRIAAYEFHYEPFLAVVKATADAGADVRIVYDARKASPGGKNAAAVANVGLTPLCQERKTNPSFISHNKFVVRIKDGQPEAVWTGGTNFSEGGIFGHSNVAHVVEDPAVAAQYLAYWNLLEQDPEASTLRPQVEALTPLPAGAPPTGTTTIFSPRSNLEALDWYAQLALGAQDGLFMTFAFGMNDVFQNVYSASTAKLRFALMEKKTRPMKAGPERDAEEAKIDVLRRRIENVFAIGSLIETNELDGWVKEKLSGLNRNVRYVHNKFMLVDPLGSDPIVVAGSANFSDASTRKNDENMLIVRGDQRVADVYLGEFMRMYSHHAFRESLQWRDPDEPAKHLRTDDWWADYFGATARSRRREFFG